LPSDFEASWMSAAMAGGVSDLPRCVTILRGSRLFDVPQVARAPGPGAISKHDWTRLGKKHLANRKVIFHTDSARAYKLKASSSRCCPRLSHPSQEESQGQWQVAVDKAKLRQDENPQAARGKSSKVKCGTQHIDRCWRFIKDRVSKGTRTRAGFASLRRKIRSAQYEYWHRGADMWMHTGEFLSTYMSDIVVPA